MATLTKARSELLGVSPLLVGPRFLRRRFWNLCPSEWGAVMSTMEDVRSAERRLEELLERLKRVGADDPNNLFGQLSKARDDYAKVVRELELR